MRDNLVLDLDYSIVLNLTTEEASPIEHTLTKKQQQKLRCIKEQIPRFAIHDVALDPNVSSNWSN